MSGESGEVGKNGQFSVIFGRAIGRESDRCARPIKLRDLSGRQSVGHRSRHSTDTITRGFGRPIGRASVERWTDAKITSNHPPDRSMHRSRGGPMVRPMGGPIRLWFSGFSPVWPKLWAFPKRAPKGYLGLYFGPDKGLSHPLFPTKCPFISFS